MTAHVVYSAGEWKKATMDGETCDRHSKKPQRCANNLGRERLQRSRYEESYMLD